MQPSTLLISTLAVVAAAAPAYPRVDLGGRSQPADAISAISAYFNVLANQVQAVKVMNSSPVCDLSKAQMPTSMMP